MEVKDISIPVRLTVLTFIVINIVLKSKINSIFISLILMYLITILLKRICSRKLTNVLTIIESVISVLISVTNEPLAIILLVIVIFENNTVIINNPIIGCSLTVLPLFFIRRQIMDSNILLVITIISIMYMFNSKSKKKISLLQRENDYTRKEIYNLQNKLRCEREVRDQYVYSLRINESNNVSYNLYESIGQTMSGTAMQLDAIKLTFNNKEQCMKLLDIGIKNLKDSATLLKENIKSIEKNRVKNGLSSISHILEEATKETMFEYKFLTEGYLDKITNEQWILLESATRTLVDNSVRYSTGNLIKVSISVMDSIIKFEVYDDGKKEMPIVKGVGLKKIEDKIEKCNGKFVIKNNNGFSVILLLTL